MVTLGPGPRHHGSGLELARERADPLCLGGGRIEPVGPALTGQCQGRATAVAATAAAIAGLIKE